MAEENARPAAVALATICQSDPSFYADEEILRPAWAPSEVLKLQPSWVTCAVDEAHVEFGGGFHHFGYALTRDRAASTPTSNRWTLHFCSEGTANRLLHTFTLPASQQLDRQQFLDGALAEYHRRAQTHPDDRDVQSRIKLLIKHNQRGQAVNSTREFSSRYPDDWLDQLLRFRIDHSCATPGASAQLDGWAARQGGFSAWLLASYAYATAGEMDSAERAVMSALAAPPDDPSWVRTHARHRGVPMCRRLLEPSRYAACAKLAEALILYKGAGTNLGPELQAIHSSATRALAGETPLMPPAPLRNQFDPFEGIAIESLSAAAATVPAAARPATNAADSGIR